MVVTYAAMSKRQTANASNLILSPTTGAETASVSILAERARGASSAVPMRYSLQRRSILAAEITLDSMTCK